MPARGSSRCARVSSGRPGVFWATKPRPSAALKASSKISPIRSMTKSPRRPVKIQPHGNDGTRATTRTGNGPSKAKRERVVDSSRKICLTAFPWAGISGVTKSNKDSQVIPPQGASALSSSNDNVWDNAIRKEHNKASEASKQNKDNKGSSKPNKGKKHSKASRDAKVSSRDVRPDSRVKSRDSKENRANRGSKGKDKRKAATRVKRDSRNSADRGNKTAVRRDRFVAAAERIV
jgi:hypothetical protein